MGVPHHGLTDRVKHWLRRSAQGVIEARVVQEDVADELATSDDPLTQALHAHLEYLEENTERPHQKRMTGMFGRLALWTLLHGPAYRDQFVSLLHRIMDDPKVHAALQEEPETSPSQWYVNLQTRAERQDSDAVAEAYSVEVRKRWLSDMDYLDEEDLEDG